MFLAVSELAETCPICDSNDNSIESLPLPASTIWEIRQYEKHNN
jgi:hypothetical protein